MSKSKTNFTIWDTDNRTNVPDVLLSRNAKTAKISKIGYRKFDIKGQISKIRHPKFDIKGQISKIGYLKSDMACRKSDMKCRKFDIKGHGHPDKCPGCPISDMGHPGLYIVCPCPKSQENQQNVPDRRGTKKPPMERRPFSSPRRARRLPDYCFSLTQAKE